MNELSPSGRALLDRARGERPAREDRARIRAKLNARLALAAGAAVASAAISAEAVSAATASGATSTAALSTGAAAAPAAATTAVLTTKAGGFMLLAKIGLAILVLGAAGAGIRAVWSSSSQHAPAAAGSVARGASDLATEGPAATFDAASLAGPSEAPPEDRPDGGDDAAAEAAAPDASPGRQPVASAPRPVASGKSGPSIAAEVALLRSAQSALESGDGEASLRAIDSLEAKHPDGAMREERQAARVLALCSVGRVDDARKAAAAFLGAFPNSVHAAKVRASCAGGR